MSRSEYVRFSTGDAAAGRARRGAWRPEHAVRSLLALVHLAALLAVSAGDATAQSSGQKSSSGSFSQSQLEQMVAPIALYDDSLLMQVLMASTYPLEVVEAARWIKQNPKIKGDAVSKAVESKPWDASVKSLCVFPDVLTKMNDNLDWTKDLGDAFLGQQDAVLKAIQTMRQKAYNSGNLKTSSQQKVVVESGSGAETQVIKIEQPSPQVVYVPTYNPAVVYGPSWSYPSWYYPSLYAYPPGYVAGASLVSFGVGMAVGSALWGGCNWSNGNVYINNNNYNRFNNVNVNNINRNNINNRTNWNHNPAHREGVGYRNQNVANRFDGGRTGGARQHMSQAQARGFEQKLGQGPGADRFKGGGQGQRGQGQKGQIGQGQKGQGQRGQANRANAGNRAGNRSAAQRSGGGGGRGSHPSAFGGGGGFSGGGNRGSFERAASSRGAASRGGGGFGGSFSQGGGGHRGGGGFQGGGGRGGGRGGGGRRR